MPTLKFTRQKRKLEFNGELLKSFWEAMPARDEYYELAVALMECGLPLSRKFNQLARKKVELSALREEPGLVNGESLVAAARALAVEDFPDKLDMELFERQYLRYRANPSIALAKTPLEFALTLIARRLADGQREKRLEYKLAQMRGQYERVLLEINGLDYPLDLVLLLVICDYCDLENTGARLVTPLYNAGHPLIWERIIYSGKLSREQRDHIWECGSIGACRKLLYDFDFFEDVTDSQAREIIELDDEEMLCSVARYMYVHYDGERRRLSDSARDELLAFVVNHKDADVARMLVTEGIPEDALRRVKGD